MCSKCNTQDTILSLTVNKLAKEVVEYGVKYHKDPWESMATCGNGWDHKSLRSNQQDFEWVDEMEGWRDSREELSNPTLSR